MSALAVALTTVVCVYGGALFGLFLQRVLPQHHLREDSKDVVKLVTGLLATLSALVLGLLIASAKSSFDAINDGFRQSAAKVILVDRLLAQYGPEAKGARELLRSTYTARIDRLFPADRRDGRASDVLRTPSAVEDIEDRLRALAPATDDQRALKARAQQLAGELALARWVSFEEANSSIPPAFLVVLVSWLVVMFMSFGLFSPRNATALVTLAIGALAVATSIFVIEEMNRPLDGLIAIPSEPMRNALAVLGR
jgi:hypothetical protein